MRPSKPLAWVLALAGVAYLGYKSEYLALDTTDALKAFILSPALVLLVFAVLVGFSDPRRRVGGSLLALGIVAMVWLSQAPIPSGWVFDTPVSAMSAERLPPYLKGPSPLLTAVSTILPLLGLSVIYRRSLSGGLLIGTALWCALCFAPSRWWSDPGMPHRDAYYYFVGSSKKSLGPWDRSDALLPIFLGIAGFAFLCRSRQVEER